MQGRNFFNMYINYIKLASKIFNVFPRFLNMFIINSISPFSFKGFILLRYVILANYFKSIKSNVYIAHNTTLLNYDSISLGENVSIHTGCYLDGRGGISIGNNVSIAHQSSILSFDHTYADITKPIKYNPLIQKKVVIKDDVWVGCGVRILSGVTIGERSIVAAGAIVTKNVESGVLVGGVPAKVIKRFN